MRHRTEPDTDTPYPCRACGVSRQSCDSLTLYRSTPCCHTCSHPAPEDT